MISILAKHVFNQYLKQYLGAGVNRSLQFDVLVNAIVLNLYTADAEACYSYLLQLMAYKKNEITRMGQFTYSHLRKPLFLSYQRFSTSQNNCTP
jgi:hypothetical protein